jgi:hypothetical protein
MKDWFPFTDYDFYAFLGAGVTVVVALDYAFFDGLLTLHDQWSFARGAAVTFASYVCGQLVAIPSAILFEDSALRRCFLRDPEQVLIDSNRNRRWPERIISPLVGKYYRALEHSIIEDIYTRAQAETGRTRQELFANPSAIFQRGFQSARQNNDIRARLDDFRNQYGFNRNLSVASLIASGTILYHWYITGQSNDLKLLAIAVTVAVGMFIRYWKYYCHYTAEVFRHYGLSLAHKHDSILGEKSNED